MSDGLLWKRENWNWPARFCKEIEPLNAKSRSVRVYVCVRERKCESKAVRARERMSEWERESERAFRSNFQKSEKSLFKLDVSQQTTTIHDSTKKQKTKNFPQEDFSSKKDFFPVHFRPFYETQLCRLESQLNSHRFKVDDVSDVVAVVAVVAASLNDSFEFVSNLKCSNNYF